MRFNIAMLFALATVAQGATASPVVEAPAKRAPTPPPTKWNDKGPEATYKFGIILCGIGAYVCNNNGQPIGRDAFFAGGVCCSTAAAAVTASQSEGYVAVARRLGAAAKVGKDRAVAGGVYAGHLLQCGVKYCQVGMQKVTGGRAPVPHRRDVSELAEIHERMGALIARYAEMEIEIHEDTPLLTKDSTPETVYEDMNSE